MIEDHSTGVAGQTHLCLCSWPLDDLTLPLNQNQERIEPFGVGRRPAITLWNFYSNYDSPELRHLRERTGNVIETLRR